MQTYTDMSDVRGDQRIDSRDLIELADELRERPLSQFGQGDIELLLAIDDLADSGIWPYGASMIREDTFEDYARELAEDLGAIDPGANWPLTCIDWNRAARELAMDYTSVSFLGFDYYVR